jgi:hypothetical protein
VTPVRRPADVLGAPVRVGDFRVGTVTGVVGDGPVERLIGLEVTGRNGQRWFLPSVAASHEDGGIDVHSTLVLVETGDLEGYGRLGAVVIRDAAALEHLAVDEDGTFLREPSWSVSPPTVAGTSVV